MAEAIRAPRGSTLQCKGWRQEAAMRMLMNNLDPEVAERPQDLVVYGGAGKAARNWPCFHAIVRELQALGNDETLLVQSGKPVGVFRTHEEAPRVLIANANLVGHWSDWDHFRALEKLGLIMYGQMTAGSWIYIGTQGILQGTYETFAAAARKHFGGSLAGRLVVTGGMGGMGGAQPLAATMNGAAFLCVEADPERIRRRVKTGYCDRTAGGLDEAREARVLLRRPSRGVDAHGADVRARERALGEDDRDALDRRVDLLPSADAGGVDQHERLAVELEGGVDGVARRAGLIVDEDALLAEHPVDERGLADVGLADEGEPQRAR